MQVLSPEITEYSDTHPMGYKEDLQRVHDKIDKLKDDLRSPAAAPITKWQKAGPVIAVCSLLLGLVVAYSAHTAGDAKSQIELEVGHQLKEPLKQIGEVASDVKEIKGILAVYGIRTFALLPQSDVPTGLPQLKASVDIASLEKIEIPTGVLTDARQKLLKVDKKTADFWTTAAAMINYQSWLNQKNGIAPDPSSVSKPCVGLTNGSGGFNIFERMRLSNCIIDLDIGNTFHDVIFEDSVIRYKGNPVALERVGFVNCRFVLDIPANPAPPRTRRLMLALLDSPDQRDIRLP